MLARCRPSLECFPNTYTHAHTYTRTPCPRQAEQLANKNAIGSDNIGHKLLSKMVRALCVRD